MSDIVLSENTRPKRDPLPAGPHLGVCYAIVDLGTKDDTYQGETRKRHKVNICFQFPDHTIEIEGKLVPVAKSKTYTLSFGDKSALRRELNNWRGRPFTPEELSGFSLRNILGKAGLVNIAHTDSGGDKIVGVMPLMKGQTAPQLEEEPYIWSTGSPGENWDRVPNWCKDEIKQSDEWATIEQFVPTMEGKAAPAPAGEEAMPF